MKIKKKKKNYYNNNNNNFIIAAAAGGDDDRNIGYHESIIVSENLHILIIQLNMFSGGMF